MRSATRVPTVAFGLVGAIALAATSVPVALGADVGHRILAAFSVTDTAVPSGHADRVPGGTTVRTPVAASVVPVRRGGRFAAVDGSPTAIQRFASRPQTGILAAYRAEAARGVDLKEARATLSGLSAERVDGALLTEVDAALSAETAQAAQIPR